jgi:hypothetical protein
MVLFIVTPLVYSLKMKMDKAPFLLYLVDVDVANSIVLQYSVIDVRHHFNSLHVYGVHASITSIHIVHDGILTYQ